MDDSDFEIKLRTVVNDLLQIRFELIKYTRRINIAEKGLNYLLEEVESLIKDSDPVPKKWLDRLEVLKEAESEIHSLSNAVWALTEDDGDDENLNYLDALSQMQTNLGKNLRGK